MLEWVVFLFGEIIQENGRVKKAEAQRNEISREVTSFKSSPLIKSMSRIQKDRKKLYPPGDNHCI